MTQLAPNEFHLTREIAALTIVGMNASAIAKELKVSRATVKRLIDTDEFRKAQSELSAEVLAPAVAMTRREIAKLVPKAVAVVDRQLDKGNLDAAKTVFKLIGADNEEAKVVDNNLTVILPGAKQEKIIEVTDAIQDGQD